MPPMPLGGRLVMNAATPENLPAGRTAKTGRGRRRLSWAHLAYFVGVPLVIAMYAGLNNWEIRHAVGIGGSLTFYAAHAFLPWWTTCLSTTALKQLLSTWKPPWLLLLLMGHFVGAALVLPYSNWLMGLYESAIAGIGVTHPETRFLSAEYWSYLARAGVIWFGVNFLFDRFIGLPLYRYTIPRGYEAKATTPSSESLVGKDQWPGQMPAFVSRLPNALSPADLVAIKAEQHYIKVVGQTKNQMVLYRFSDAVNELPPGLGTQVHRSYWVKTDAIANVHGRAKDFYLTMTNGEKVPVSGPYQGMIRELARSQGITLKA
ncbi:MAG: LytTR family transcriptional regulator [Gammaproteobacteria bacterium]|nr:LytTR family transcriptional regulator [Gammaproteobacteria bacterium]